MNGRFSVPPEASGEARPGGQLHDIRATKQFFKAVHGALIHAISAA